MGFGMAAFGQLTSQQAKREKEAELLFVGDAYRQAIAQYYESGPGGHKRYPQSLEQLLTDERFAFDRRYIRRLYRDPVTGKEFGLLKAPEGGIMGVYSPSEEAPLKSANFPPEYASFESASRLNEWQFVYMPPG
jgi:type II secretory pathway pseudopilin PulG